MHIKVYLCRVTSLVMSLFASDHLSRVILSVPVPLSRKENKGSHVEPNKAMHPSCLMCGDLGKVAMHLLA